MSSKLSTMPNIPIPLSRFKQDFNHCFSMYHGDVVPVDCFEVLPGDKFSYNLASLIRMSTPLVPIMGNIEAYLHAFFVPMRLVWDDAEKFYGDPSNHDKVSTITAVDPTTVIIPEFTSGTSVYKTGTTLYTRAEFDHCVSDYLGKPDLPGTFGTVGLSPSQINGWFNRHHISCLKERGYCVIWNDHFRPSLLVPPILVNKTSSAINGSMIGTETFTTGNLVPLTYVFSPFKGMKKYDYFTANTLSPQFGNSVTLPLGTYAPVGIDIVNTSQAATPVDSLLYSSSTLGFTPIRATNSGNVPGGSDLAGSDLRADLSQATAATINELRYAFQVQKYLERSNYGSRYFEILNAHYGVTNPDLRLQRSQRLGTHKFYINISQVLSTNDSSDVNLGQTGAVSVTGDKCNLFTASFDEPGYIYVLITTKYDRNYSGGFLREDLKSNRFEFYSPEFANLGDQVTKKIELSVSEAGGGFYSQDGAFGYQEHWAEYRYRKNLVSGALKPGRGLDIWTLADDFSNVAQNDLVPGYSFLKEDRVSLARCLVTGTSGPDYICDFRADIIATREMPLYSIPGLIDHFGAL